MIKRTVNFIVLLISFLPVCIMSKGLELRYAEHGFHADWFVADESNGRAVIVVGGAEGGCRMQQDISYILKLPWTYSAHSVLNIYL